MRRSKHRPVYIPPTAAAALKNADFRVMPAMMEMEFGAAGKPPSGYPLWVSQCGKKVCQALFPKAYQFHNPKAAEAYKLGLAIGMVQAGEMKLNDSAKEMGIESADSRPTPDQSAAFVTLIYGADSGLTLPKDGSSLVPIQISAEFRRALDEMNLEEKADAHRGMSDAYAMISGRNASTLATQPYSTMLIYWRVVETLPSIDRLHQFLSGVHGASVIGSDVRRTQQLCWRIGKRFRIPGRPKKLPHP